MSKITNYNGFRARVALQRAAKDKRVQLIEGDGMDPGRVFIHLASGYWFGRGHRTTLHSVGSAAEVRDAMAMIEKRPEAA